MLFPNWHPSGLGNDGPFNPDPGDDTGGGGDGLWFLNSGVVEPINNYNVRIVGLNVASLTQNFATITNIVNSNSSGSRINDYSLMTSQVINDLITYEVKQGEQFEEWRVDAMPVLMPKDEYQLIGSNQGGIFEGGVRIGPKTWISSVVESSSVASVGSSDRSIYTTAAVQELLKNNAGDESPFNIDKSNQKINLKNEFNNYPVITNKSQAQQFQGIDSSGAVVGSAVFGFYGMDALQQGSMEGLVFTIPGVIEYIEQVGIKGLRKYEDLTYTITNREAERLPVDITPGDGFSFREKDIKYPFKIKVRITNARPNTTPYTEECEYLIKGGEIPTSSLYAPVYHAVWGSSFVLYLWAFSYDTGTADGIRYIVNSKSAYGGSCKFEAGGSVWFIETVNNGPTPNDTEQLALLSDIDRKVEIANLWHDTGHETSNITPKNTSAIVEVPMLKTNRIHIVNRSGANKYIDDVITKDELTTPSDDAIYSSLKVDALVNDSNLWMNTGTATAHLEPKDRTAVVEVASLKTQSVSFTNGTSNNSDINGTITSTDTTTAASDVLVYSSLKVDSLLSTVTGSKWPPGYSVTMYKGQDPNVWFKDFIPDGYMFGLFDVTAKSYAEQTTGTFHTRVFQTLENGVLSLTLTVPADSLGNVRYEGVFNDWSIIYNIYAKRAETFKDENVHTDALAKASINGSHLPIVSIYETKAHASEPTSEAFPIYYSYIKWTLGDSANIGQVTLSYEGRLSGPPTVAFLQADLTTTVSFNLGPVQQLNIGDYDENSITSTKWVLVPT